MSDMDITEEDMQGIPCTREKGESRYIVIYFFSRLFKYIYLCLLLDIYFMFYLPFYVKFLYTVMHPREWWLMKRKKEFLMNKGPLVMRMKTEFED